jgi:uncharacterized membrane protein
MIYISEIKKRSIDQLSGNWITVAITLVTTYVLFILSFFIIGSLLAIFTLFNYDLYYILFSTIFTIASGPILAANINFYYSIANGNKARFEDFFISKNIFLKSIGITFATSIIQGFVFTISDLTGLFIIKLIMIFVWIYLSQAMYVLIQNQDTPVLNCLKRSVFLLRKRVFKYILLNLSFIGWFIIAVLLFSIVLRGLFLLWLIPYLSLTYVNFYLELNNFIIE